QSCLLHHIRLPTLSSTRVFWGADEELSDRDYVPEPMYPKYIPLEDEHVLLAGEQPLPPVNSPTVESPGYVAESDPEADPEEYEDDKAEEGLVDYPIDGGDDGDDDDGDSSGDDADDEDEDEEDEEEHLALADSAVVVPTVELVTPPEGTESVIPSPSTDIATTGARITQSCLLHHIRLPTLSSTRVFWGADEELSDRDYVPEPMYPKYIPLEDEHVLLAGEQPLPPVNSPTVESPGYVAESDPEADPEEYEDDKAEDGLVDYPIDGGDDRDDDDGDSSGDDA
nr:hypothetical protein [Tanacetum cinerariifolium]